MSEPERCDGAAREALRAITGDEHVWESLPGEVQEQAARALTGAPCPHEKRVRNLEAQREVVSQELLRLEERALAFGRALEAESAEARQGWQQAEKRLRQGEALLRRAIEQFPSDLSWRTESASFLQRAKEGASD